MQESMQEKQQGTRQVCIQGWQQAPKGENEPEKQQGTKQLGIKESVKEQSRKYPRNLARIYACVNVRKLARKQGSVYARKYKGIGKCVCK